MESEKARKKRHMPRSCSSRWVVVVSRICTARAGGNGKFPLSELNARRIRAGRGGGCCCWLLKIKKTLPIPARTAEIVLAASFIAPLHRRTPA